jgi:cell division protein FtsQ
MMGARRNQKTHKQRKLDVYEWLPAWLNQRLFGVLILAVVLGAPSGFGIWYLAQPGTLPIQSVKVEGEFRYLAQQDVYEVVGGLASGGFFNVDVHAVKMAAESLPWVDSASVRRAWPDTLRLEITEQVPLARWGEQKIVNMRGELFQPLMKDLSDKLPKFTGPAGTGQKVAINYLSLSKRMAQINLRISEITLTDRRAWNVRLTNGLYLSMGRIVNNERLDRFISVYPKLLGEKTAQIDSVDLRYANGFAVRWKTRSTS